MMDSSNEINLGDIQSLKAKVFRSWYEDEVFEISLGIFMLFCSTAWFVDGSQFLPQILPKNLYVIVRLSWILTLIVVIFGLFRLIKKLKRKFVWGTTGYSMNVDAYPKSVRIFLPLAFLFLFFATFRRHFLGPEIRILLTGLSLCLAYIAQFIQSGKIKRFLVLSLLPLVVAVVNIFLGLSWKQNLYLMILLIGCASIVSGIIAYRDFRRKLTE